MATTKTVCAPSAANRLGLDLAAEAEKLGKPPVPIVDAHTHIGGVRAAKIYDRVRKLYGIERIYSMTRLDQVDAMRDIFGDDMRFIAVPDFAGSDKGYSFREGYLDHIRKFHAKGARMVKFFAAPRMHDFAAQMDDPDLAPLDGHWRVKAAELACELGMMCMTHVADPDTWFRAKYADAKRYGTKQEQYIPLERMLDRFSVPWIAAHMGGWPENLDFLSGLLERHDNLYLDTSATKWMIRELSKHPSEVFVAFLSQWKGRILFGSDIVTTDEHLDGAHSERGMGKLATNEGEAFDLYASRYWCLRTMYETEYRGESLIADPDLSMVEPDRYDAMSAPAITGHGVPTDVLQSLYSGAATVLLDAWYATEG